MKKYSKSGVRKKRFVGIIIMLFIIILILTVSFLGFIIVKNNIVFEKVIDSASHVSDDIAKNSTPIIIDNVLVGGIYDKTWVSTERVYLNSKNTIDIDIDIYNKNGKAGSYKLSSLSKSTNGGTVYATTSNTNNMSEYLAIAKLNNDIMNVPGTKIININEEHISLAKKALGIYRLFNTSIKITEAYEITLAHGNRAQVMFVTNETSKSMGVYSAVIFVNDIGKPSLVKYNYIKNTKKAENWPIYSFKFIADLNQDGMCELIIQETKEFEVKYDVLELKNNKFYEIMSSTIKI